MGWFDKPATPAELRALKAGKRVRASVAKQAAEKANRQAQIKAGKAQRSADARAIKSSQAKVDRANAKAAKARADKASREDLDLL
jgi:hypothetical protein